MLIFHISVTKLKHKITEKKDFFAIVYTSVPSISKYTQQNVQQDGRTEEDGVLHPCNQGNTCNQGNNVETLEHKEEEKSVNSYLYY